MNMDNVCVDVFYCLFLYLLINLLDFSHHFYEQAPEGESQPSTEVDLFVSTEKIMVLNTDLQVRLVHFTPFLVLRYLTRDT